HRPFQGLRLRGNELRRGSSGRDSWPERPVRRRPCARRERGASQGRPPGRLRRWRWWWRSSRWRRWLRRRRLRRWPRLLIAPVSTPVSTTGPAGPVCFSVERRVPAIAAQRGRREADAPTLLDALTPGVALQLPLHQFVAEQREHARAEEDRTGVAIPVDARSLAGVVARGLRLRLQLAQRLEGQIALAQVEHRRRAVPAAVDAVSAGRFRAQHRQPEQALFGATGLEEEAMRARLALARPGLHEAIGDARSIGREPHAAEMQILAGAADEQRVAAHGLDALDAVARLQRDRLRAVSGVAQRPRAAECAVAAVRTQRVGAAPQQPVADKAVLQRMARRARQLAIVLALRGAVAVAEGGERHAQ